MGWIAVFVIVPLYRAARPLPLLWLLIGGLMYTAGGIIYAVKKPDIFPGWLGFHEIFHIFVILGSASHYVMILRFC
jgi:hemolysin III